MDPVPKNYSDARQVQRDDTILILEKYSKKFLWRKDGRDTLLDLGCGTGDNLSELIFPLMPGDFGEVVGVDISKKMVEYAHRNFHRKNVNFYILDIEGDIRPFLAKYPKGFDHITSFYTLHWMQSLETAFENIYNLVSSGGDCLVAFFTYQPLVDVFDTLTKKPKWNKFMSSMYDYIWPSINKNNSVSLVVEALEKGGFRDYKYEVLKKSVCYIGDDAIKANISVIHPAFPKMSDEEKNEYWVDFFDLTAELKFYTKAVDPKMCTLIAPYDLIVIHAVK